MLYKMLTGTFPYQGDSEQEVNLRIQSGDIKIETEEWNKLKAPPVLQDLIRNMLESKVHERYTAD
jgi:serine/threonine protein kinase